MNWRNLFSFSGRAGREEFAAVNFLTQLISFMLVLGMGLLAPSTDQFTLGRAFLLLGMGLLSLVVSIFLIWLSFAVFFRRLHDLNLSGWWFIGYIIAIILFALIIPQVWWLFTVLGLAFVLLLSLKKAPASPNRFAPQAEPFFPQFFSVRPWALGALVAITVCLSLLVTLSSQVRNTQVPF